MRGKESTRKRLEEQSLVADKNPTCRIRDLERCGKPAPHHRMEVTFEIMGKDVLVKVPVCDEHYYILSDGINTDYSIGEKA
jgi:hypothetical protein